MILKSKPITVALTCGLAITSGMAFSGGIEQEVLMSILNYEYLVLIGVMLLLIGHTWGCISWRMAPIFMGNIAFLSSIYIPEITNALLGVTPFSLDVIDLAIIVGPHLAVFSIFCKPNSVLSLAKMKGAFRGGYGS